MKRVTASADYQQIREIDQELIAAWRKILDYEPQNDGEKKRLASFLLDFLVADEIAGNEAQRASDKILSMFDT